MTNYLDEPDAGVRICRRCDEWAQISAPGDGVTRLYLTPEHRAAADLLMQWMDEAGMECRMDEAGNVVGRYHAATGGGPYLISGSHLDSVTNGGKYDGPIGVLTALDCVSVLNDRGVRLPYGIEVVAFGDEEGGRFLTTLFGSRAVAGGIDQAMLEATDASGMTVAEALKEFGLEPSQLGKAKHDPDDVLGFVEIHIEQGPVLETEDLPIGVVTGIAGQTRAWIHLSSPTNHAGTVPMHLRTDAVSAACELTLAIEKIARDSGNTLATVGAINVEPGEANVIPGNVTMSLDCRAPNDADRRVAIDTIRAKMQAIGKSRGVATKFEKLFETSPCPCDSRFIGQLERAIESVGVRPIRIPSGAGHDAIAMSELTKTGMLFLRCKNGVSHSPEESVNPKDVAVGAAALLIFIENFQQV